MFGDFKVRTLGKFCIRILTRNTCCMPSDMDEVMMGGRKDSIEANCDAVTVILNIRNINSINKSQELNVSNGW